MSTQTAMTTAPSIALRPWLPRRRIGTDRLIVGAGVVVEAALVIGLLWPLRVWQPPDAITDPEPLSRMTGRSAEGLAAFVLTLVIWSLGYLTALMLSRRLLSRAGRWALFGFPVLFAVTLAPTWPAASKDLYHYILEGRALAVHGQSPLTTAPAELPRDALAWVLSSWQWEPSRYGPLWALVAALPVVIAGDDLVLSVLGFKAIAVASFVAACGLTYLMARRLAPAKACAAYAAIAWNPLFLFESAANGHNDTLMLALTALALYLAARGDWTLAFPALAAAVLVKYTTGLIGPLLLVWAWREARRNAEARGRLLAGLAVAVWLVVAAYLLFWEGPATLAALGGAAGDAFNSPGWLLREALTRAGPSERTAALIVGVPLAAAFVAGYALALRMTWRAERFVTILGAGLLALAAYLLTVSWWFWPWYITWLLPLAAPLAFAAPVRLVIVWSLGGLAAYIPSAYRPYFWGEPPDGRMPLWVAVATFLPLAVAALVLLARRRRGGSSEVAAGPPPASDHGPRSTVAQVQRP
jgi:hypothetical protein